MNANQKGGEGSTPTRRKGNHRDICIARSWFVNAFRDWFEREPTETEMHTFIGSFFANLDEMLKDHARSLQESGEIKGNDEIKR